MHRRISLSAVIGVQDIRNQPQFKIQWTNLNLTTNRNHIPKPLTLSLTVTLTFNPASPKPKPQFRLHKQ